MASSSSCFGDITITTSADAEPIANCETYSGDILISSDASGSIEINGVRAIDGNLSAESVPSLTSVSADALVIVRQTLSFSSCTILANLQFDQLNSVSDLDLVALPALQSLNFGTGVSQSYNVQIRDTALESLSGIELDFVRSLNVTNNRYLTSIDMNALQNVTEFLEIAANGRDLAVSFPNLARVANLTASNISSLSIPSLIDVSGNLGIYFSSMESISAPNLTNVDVDLALVSNGRLASLDFPELQEIGGGFLIANNTDLLSVDGFDSLDTIYGALDFRGTFDNVTLPQLSGVYEGAKVESSTTDQSLCDVFDRAASRGIIRGGMTCRSNADTESTEGGGTSGTTSGTSGGSGPGAGAIAGIVIGLLLVIAAAILFWWFYQRKRKPRGHTKPEIPGPRPGHHQLPLGGHHEKPELYGGVNQVSELSGRDAEGAGARGRREVRPGVAEIDSSPLEIREAELSSTSATTTENQSTTNAASAKHSNPTTEADFSGHGPQEHVPASANVAAHSGRKDLDQPGMEVVVEPEHSHSRQTGIGHTITATMRPQTETRPPGVHPEFVCELRDLDRELDEGLITRKGYDVRRDRLFMRYFPSSDGAPHELEAGQS
ncbi:uncharacterized protein HMPREF1541_00850 [Cyphellophora europaea CBS 101466]|uniref:Receptor L-domain domain-containing protein n=1 Tax=Cyphellophora europaea (strain CBS 101466) TaxID=1220924 RepID=W2SFH8_CYPE1|nr:uncharacterized protein HMPREF1541_00850 [Cyphellophora europaea CBS 101466]ETN46664.1 hypothetical protein HMPREF1541_00850 [Cyphellophora europaea CBS 101466]